MAFGQSAGLPAMQATNGVTAASSAVGPRVPAKPVTHRAVVVYSGDELSVTANNSGLNQILREIARQTGLKITGGVADERVYGKYGPGPVGQVLASLLTGTGSNMYLRGTGSDTPGELILTPRGGGAAPPSPSAAIFDEPPEPAEESAPPPAPQPVVVNAPVPLPVSQPVPTPPITSIQETPQTPPPAGFVSAPTVAPATEPGTTPGPNTQATGTSDPTAGANSTTSPNGVKTPEEIYRQLQLLQQQQQKPANPN
jgi:hypothetical protein